MIVEADGWPSPAIYTAPRVSFQSISFRFLLGELPAGAPGGLWLQAEGCCSRSSWAALEVSANGGLALTHGWQAFARARGLGRRCTLHFRFDGDATLYVRVFGEDGRRAGCCPEEDDRGRGPRPNGDGGDSARADGGVRDSPSFVNSSSSDSSSGGRSQPPRRRACLGGGGRPPAVT